MGAQNFHRFLRPAQRRGARRRVPKPYSRLRRQRTAYGRQLRRERRRCQRRLAARQPTRQALRCMDTLIARRGTGLGTRTARQRLLAA